MDRSLLLSSMSTPTSNVLHSRQLLPDAVPASNTGVASASGLVDYLGYTVPADIDVDQLLASLGGGEKWKRSRRGHNGYATVLRCGDVKIYLDGEPRMGVHVDITGQGCRQLERTGVVDDWGQFLSHLTATWQARATRIDVALDDRAGCLSLNRITETIKRGGLLSRLRPSGLFDPFAPPEGASHTIYLGAKSSDLRIRIYDKAVESRVKGHWMRVEVEAKRKYARELVQQVAQHGPGIISSVLRGYMDFKQPGQATQKCRWATEEWWQRFLGDCERVRLTSPEAPRISGQRMQWLYTSVAPALAELALDYGANGVERLLLAGLSTLRRRRQISPAITDELCAEIASGIAAIVVEGRSDP